MVPEFRRRPPHRVLRTALLGAVLCLGTVAGCRAPDRAAVRAAESDRVRERLRAETAAVLAQYGPDLTLDECQAIAAVRSRNLAAARTAARIGRIDRRQAFSAFLPQVTAAYDFTAFDQPVLKSLGGPGVEVQDQRVQAATLEVAQPLFTPSAWLLYVSASRGADIRELALQRARQMVELDVARAYYRVRHAEAGLAAAAAATASAEALRDELRALAGEGYALAADVARAEAFSAEAAHQLAERRRERHFSQAALLARLDLWPLAEVTLAPGPDPLPPPPPDFPAAVRAESPAALLQVPLEAWLCEALLRRPDLAQQDRTVELRRNEVRRAVALFLPELTGFASYTHTTDSYTVNQQYWVGGIQGVLSAFAGFRNVSAYLRAREEAREAAIAREEATMAVLLQVVEADRLLREMVERHRVAEELAAAAAAAAAVGRHRYEDGLLELSGHLALERDALAARARSDEARLSLDLAVYAFRNVMGIDAQGTPP